MGVRKQAVSGRTDSWLARRSKQMTPPRECAAMETLPEKRRQCWRKSDTMRFISAATSSRITWGWCVVG